MSTIGVPPCLLRALLLVGLTIIVGGADDKKRAPPKVQLKHHSFAAPLNHAEALDDWRLSGASIVGKDRVLLHPNVAERAGFMWSKKSLLTNHFEATLQFRVMGPDKPDQMSPDQGFALWYVMENHAAEFQEAVPIAAKSWQDGLQQLGLTLVGARPKFEGVGAVLTLGNSKQVAAPLVSGIVNDGSKELQFGSDVPTGTAKSIDFRNTLNPAQLKLDVTPTSVTASLKQSPSLSWKECFRIEGIQVKSGGFLGFTAWSGAGPQSDLVALYALEVNNLDENSIGEEMMDADNGTQKKYEEMLADASRHFVDQKAQTDHLQQLIGMLETHAKEIGPQDRLMHDKLGEMQARMTKLEEDCRVLVKELSILVGDDKAGTGDAVSSIKENLVGMRRFFDEDSKNHRDGVARLANKVRDVKMVQESKAKSPVFGAISEQSKSLEKTVSTRNQNMTGMLVTIVGCVLFIGLLMWNRMRYYEKKHFI